MFELRPDLTWSGRWVFGSNTCMVNSVNEVRQTVKSRNVVMMSQETEIADPVTWRSGSISATDEMYVYRVQTWRLCHLRMIDDWLAILAKLPYSWYPPLTTEQQPVIYSDPLANARGSSNVHDGLERRKQQESIEAKAYSCGDTSCSADGEEPWRVYRSMCKEVGIKRGRN